MEIYLPLRMNPRYTSIKIPNFLSWFKISLHLFQTLDICAKEETDVHQENCNSDGFDICRLKCLDTETGSPVSVVSEKQTDCDSPFLGSLIHSKMVISMEDEVTQKLKVSFFHSLNPLANFVGVQIKWERGRVIESWFQFDWLILSVLAHWHTCLSFF